MPATSPLADLAPQPLWSLFAGICAIPHPSGQEQQLRDWICSRMAQRGLDYLVDEVGNLIIRKPATPGREHVPGVILQAHLDMVCQNNADTPHDFSRDPIRPQRRDGWLVAGTAGAEVRAVAPGRVAFSDWLKGYGLLTIIDHGDGWMSLYAFNDALLKDVGDWVRAGDPLATVGSSGGQGRPALYFELRRNGQPQDPKPWLRP